jgi:hypothetical protein
MTRNAVDLAEKTATSTATRLTGGGVFPQVHADAQILSGQVQIRLRGLSTLPAPTRQAPPTTARIKTDP